MLALKIEKITEEEYLEVERSSEIKHEYHDGEMFAMSGATIRHGMIVTNILLSLGNQLRRKPCRVLSTDIKLKVEKLRKYFYPDIVIVCGKRLPVDDSHDILYDADVIIEVLSDSTESYDRGEKFSYYRKLDSLKEYIVISQKKKKIEQFSKNEKDYFQVVETDDQNEILIESIECKLTLEDIYENCNMS